MPRYKTENLITIGGDYHKYVVTRYESDTELVERFRSLYGDWGREVYHWLNLRDEEVPVGIVAKKVIDGLLHRHAIRIHEVYEVSAEMNPETFMLQPSSVELITKKKG